VLNGFWARCTPVKDFSAFAPSTRVDGLAK
jgi:hypothetical protein